MSDIVLKMEHRKAIVGLGEAQYPNAARGLLLGQRDGTIKEVADLVFFENTAPKRG